MRWTWRIRAFQRAELETSSHRQARCLFFRGDLHSGTLLRTPAWREVVAPYERRNNARALRQLATTWLLLAAMLVVMYRGSQISVWLVPALGIPTGLLLVRTFIIMHDCAHGSFLRRSARTSVSGGSPAC